MTAPSSPRTADLDVLAAPVLPAVRARIEAAIEREAARLASQASTAHTAVLMRYACQRAREAADLALVRMTIPARDSSRGSCE